ncbi:MAG TPA: hypothetical protein VLE21_04400 [Candidatus Nitrosocosmicus sp.]|nr:hypothetical protein [Candidatus Nitrosocosmicus sp.]
MNSQQINIGDLVRFKGFGVEGVNNPDNFPPGTIDKVITFDMTDDKQIAITTSLMPLIVRHEIFGDHTIKAINIKCFEKVKSDKKADKNIIFTTVKEKA